jgi:hypothetical protein
MSEFCSFSGQTREIIVTGSTAGSTPGIMLAVLRMALANAGNDA